VVLDQVSTPHSTQARLDTRPGSIAGPEDTDREPPLPPVDGPPPWATALAAVASAAGSSGIGAILFAFALMPALWLRARDGSAVRRPTTAFAELDVPV
jgi:hypothetical protein